MCLPRIHLSTNFISSFGNQSLPNTKRTLARKYTTYITMIEWLDPNRIALYQFTGKPKITILLLVRETVKEVTALSFYVLYKSVV